MIHDTAKRLTRACLFATLTEGSIGCNGLTGPKYLDPDHAPCGDGWIDLCNGEDMAGWKNRHSNRPMSWKVVDGVMVNTSTVEAKGVNIVSEQKFDDF